MHQDVELIEIEKILNAADYHGRRVLEIGCGDGRVTQHLALKAREYYAIDPDVKKLNIARQRIPEVFFRTGSGERLDFNNEYFDLVLFTMSLHHQNADISLSETARVLKKRGKALVLEPLPKGEIQQIFHVFNNEMKKLESAQNSIESSPLKKLKREIFNTIWQFKDFQEIIDYDFCENLGMNRSQIEQIKEIIGEKNNSSPIQLSDELVLTVLQKELSIAEKGGTNEHNIFLAYRTGSWMAGRTNYER